MGVCADVTEVGEYSAGSVGIELGHIRAESPNLATSTYRNRQYLQSSNMHDVSIRDNNVLRASC